MLIIFREQITEKIKLEKEEINHIKALRLKEKDLIFVSNGKGIAYNATLQKDYTLQVNRDQPAKTKSFQNISIATAIPDGNRFEKMIDMATQLGVSNVYPIIFERSNRKSFSIERTKKIIKQACSQSQNFLLPEIHSPMHYFEFVKKIEKFYFLFYADPTKENNLNINEIYKFISKNPLKEILVIVGPEGGFSLKEREHLKNNYKAIYLSENILRIETAVISLLSIFSFLYQNYQT